MQLLKDAAFAIRIAVADPDLQVRWEGGHPDPETRGGGLSLVWKQGGGPPRAPPLDPPLDSTR